MHQYIILHVAGRHFVIKPTRHGFLHHVSFAELVFSVLYEILRKHSRLLIFWQHKRRNLVPPFCSFSCVFTNLLPASKEAAACVFHRPSYISLLLPSYVMCINEFWVYWNHPVRNVTPGNLLTIYTYTSAIDKAMILSDRDISPHYTQ